MQCQVCRTSGSNMRKCSACNQVHCKGCASKGKGHYPKLKAVNKCPYCGKTGVLKTA